MYRLTSQVDRPPREGVGPRRGIESEAIEPACPRQGIEAVLQRALELSDCVLRKTMNSDICFSWQELTPKFVFYVRSSKMMVALSSLPVRCSLLEKR